MIFNLIRRFGSWVMQWPCEHGHHEWGLWRAGSAFWSRECNHCGDCEFTSHPDRREDCDIDHYNNVYLPRFEKP